MDNNLIEQLNAQIHHAAHHAVDEAMGSAGAVNRSVGESMRHIGQLLFNHSAPYLPVRPDEIMVKPHPLNPTSLDAVVLINRQLRGENTFMVLFTTKGEESMRTIDLVAYREDPFELTKTRFIKITPELGNELIRQANVLIQGEGVTLLQAVLVTNHFTEEAPHTEPTSALEVDGLFSSDMSPEEPAPTPAPEQRYDGNGLPEVSHELV